MKQIRYWASILVCGITLWFGLISGAEASDRPPQSNTRHILERLSFGATSEQIDRAEANGIEAYIQSQLNPQSIQESEIVNDYLAKFNANYKEPLELRKMLVANYKKIRNSQQFPEQKRKLQKEAGNLKQKAKDEAIQLRLARSIYSSRQLQEVMVDFWLNHFNVFANKGAASFWLSDYENELRANALGNFRDLLEVTATNPAMLIYLDNEFNTDPKSPKAKGKYSGLNENYARELMELHTLGVDGGYSQDDIITLAKIFTGWTVAYSGKQGDKKGFFFNSKRHDRTEKMFLGQKIEAGGIEQGQKALDILASHSATARFISYKLAQYFVADRPPSELVDSLTQSFLDSNGNIKIVMDTLIHSEEFNSSEYIHQKFKTPYQYLISLIRMGEIQQPNLKRVQGMLSQLSMPIYMHIAPIGYKNTQDAWLNPQAMLQRIIFAKAIADKRLNSDSPVKYSVLTKNIGELSPQTQKAIANSPKLRTALVLGSPEAMYR